ncbi:unnamed protein product [Lactuca virosa]|uniref:RING-type domain-containing protein n=1 Tax=Lactuca virosa TaxID=75947 RepID=A0AAU9PPU0_9ASTR|nr:unnamed protein product [Lactuca virosa]
MEDNRRIETEDHQEFEEDEGMESLNRGEIDSLFCPICFEAWTSGGEHQICCLPCGHIYGFSCINKWLKRSPNCRKCPQCKKLCKLKDVRVLYAARLCVADEELQKRVITLEAECAYLKQSHKSVYERVLEEMRNEMDEKSMELKGKFREICEEMDARHKLNEARCEALEKMFPEMPNMRGN